MAGLTLLLGVAMGALLATPLGTWALDRVLPGLLPAGVTARGLGGRLAGELHLQTLRVEGDGFVLDVHDVSVRYAPWGLVLAPRALHIEALRAAEVTITQTASAQARPAPTAQAPLPLGAPELPVAITLSALDLETLRATSTSGLEATMQRVRAAARWDADGVVLETFRLQGRIATAPEDALAAELKVRANARWPTDPLTPAAMELTLEGEGDGWPSLALTVTLDGALAERVDVSARSEAPLAASATLAVEGLDDLSSAQGQGRLLLPDAIDLASVAPQLTPLTLRGVIDARMDPQALTVQPALSVGLDAFEFIAAGQRQLQASGSLRIPRTSASSPARLHIEPVSVRLGDEAGAAGVLTLRGMASADQTVEGALRIDGLNPAWVAPQWQGQLGGDIAFSAAVTPGRALPTVRLEALQLEGLLRDQPITVEGQATLSDQGRLNVDGFRAQSGEAQLRTDGSLTLSPAGGWLPTEAALQASLDVPDLAQVLPGGSGRLSADASLAGDWSTPAIEAHLDAEDLAVEDALRLEEIHGEITVAGRDKLSVEGAVRGLVVASTPIEQIDVSAAGSLEQHALSIALSHPAATLRSTLQASADIDASRWTGQLNTFALSALDRVWQLADDDGDDIDPATPARLSLSPQAQSVSSLCLAAPPHSDRLCLQAKLAGEEVDAHITLASVAIAPWASVLALPVSVHGALQGEARVQRRAGDLPRIVGDVRVSPGRLGSNATDPDGGELDAVRWNALSLRIDTIEDALVAEGTADLADAGRLDVDASLPRAALGLGAELGAQPITANVSGKLQVPPRLADALPGVTALSGATTVNLTAQGHLRAPRLRGQLQVEDVAGDVAAAGVHLRDGTVTLTAESDQIRFTASAGTGEGVLNATGEFALDAEHGWRGALSLDGERVLVTDTPEVRALISPALRAEVNPAEQLIRLRGTVLVPEAQVTPIDLSDAVSTSPDEVIVGEGTAAPTSAWRTDAQITLGLGPAVSYKGGGFKASLQGELTVRERPGEIPTGDGELSVADARFSAFGQTLEVNRGRVIFLSSPLTNPGLDVQASRTVDDVTVRVDVRGTLREQVITLSSTPALPQADALSYLVVGRPVSELQGGGGDSELLANAARQGGLAGADLLARRVGRRIGLDEFAVERDQGGENAQLVVGKYLSPRLYVRYGLGLFETLNTWLLRYDLSRRWAVETQTGAQNSVDVLYSIEN